ncbi:MAG: phosphoribosylamine--glycine ligase [Clostridia bacterium]|nr:phosphoribosylamine--glycine ligase [Clostridia bacterium]
MKVLVIGGGGREHAICCQLKKSKKVTKLYCAPGNAGIAEVAECVPISVLSFEKIIEFAKTEHIDLVFVAPDDPLALGLVNELEKAGIRAFGPTKEAAIIEGSKAFSKDFMKRNSIPTASYEVFSDFEKAKQYLEKFNYPVVLKADGLALGKGVLICEDEKSALLGLSQIMLDKVFGMAGSSVVIEEFLEGKEVTVLAFTDGETVKCMPASQDHKKAFDNDKGLNTGGMGAFAPTLTYTEEIANETLDNIILPTISALSRENRTFKGVIYFGLMLTKNGVKVIEYNARFGDPETQVVLPLLKTDFVNVVDACIDGTLSDLSIEWENKTGFCVVVASGGYPSNVVKGYPITIEPMSKDIKIFHSGTRIDNGVLVTNGGRVLCVTTIADNIEQARQIVYGQIDKIKFTDSRYRTDIGIK